MEAGVSAKPSLYVWPAKVPISIYSAAEEIEAAGGRALPLQVDIRYEDQVAGAIAKTVETFGGIDILINNASAISLTDTPNTDMKRYDLMHNINVRGNFMEVCTAPSQKIIQSSYPGIVTPFEPGSQMVWQSSGIYPQQNEYESMCTGLGRRV